MTPFNFNSIRTALTLFLCLTFHSTFFSFFFFNYLFTQIFFFFIYPEMAQLAQIVNLGNLVSPPKIPEPTRQITHTSLSITSLPRGLSSRLTYSPGSLSSVGALGRSSRHRAVLLRTSGASRSAGSRRPPVRLAQQKNWQQTVHIAKNTAAIRGR